MQKENEGVYFVSDDYANCIQRIIIMGVDTFVILFGYLLFVESSSSVGLSQEGEVAMLYGGFLLFGYLYLVEMKRRCGSLGNLLTSTRVISINGQMPSVFFMSTRSVFSLMTIPLAVADIFWMMGDSSRQMVRDKFSGVYVIKKGAKISGRGEIVYTNYMLAGHTFMFRDVKEAKR